MRLRYTERLRRELDELERYVAEQASAKTAADYVSRLIDSFDGLAIMPGRHPLRPEFGRDVRACVFEGRIMVVFRVESETVSLLALFGPGRRAQLIEETP